MNNFFHWRQNNNPVLKRSYNCFKGLSDIIVVHPPTGRFIGIEVKSKKGKQSTDQEIFQMRLEAAGGLYILAYELDDVVNAFKTLKN